MAIHVLSLSYGKDSLACLGAIEKLGWPLDRIVHAEVWATETIPADLPPMVEFKEKADEIIKERWGITVEHVAATTTFEKVFYKHRQSGKHEGEIHGFPMARGAWCQDRLKGNALDAAKKLTHTERARDGSQATVSYVGIAADEPERLARLDGITKVSPLAAIGWDEATCRKWCEDNDLLSPIYTTAARGGCWFCHNQGVEQLRLLRKTHPELWALLMKWDSDSPVSFRPDGHTVHDFDRRFFFEDLGIVPCDRKFRWKMLETALSK